MSAAGGPPMTVGAVGALLARGPADATLLVAGPGGAYEVLHVVVLPPDTAGALAFGVRPGERAVVLEVARRERPTRRRR